MQETFDDLDDDMTFVVKVDINCGLDGRDWFVQATSKSTGLSLGYLDKDTGEPLRDGDGTWFHTKDEAVACMMKFYGQPYDPKVWKPVPLF
jgi:hypothetical protein